jgi:hypothetical protein
MSQFKLPFKMTLLNNIFHLIRHSISLNGSPTLMLKIYLIWKGQLTSLGEFLKNY